MFCAVDLTITSCAGARNTSLHPTGAKAQSVTQPSLTPAFAGTYPPSGVLRAPEKIARGRGSGDVTPIG